jgi:hypothetical protein
MMVFTASRLDRRQEPGQQGMTGGGKEEGWWCWGVEVVEVVKTQREGSGDRERRESAC